MSQHEEDEQECEFVCEHTIGDILPATVNLYNTLARAKVDDVLYLFILHQDLSKVDYSSANFDEYPLLPLLRSTLKLEIPNETYIAKHKVCVIVYGDVAYIIAPYHD